MEKSLYDQDTYGLTLDRVNKLTQDSIPHWGKMDAAQMLAHCAEVLDVANGKPLEGTPLIAKLFKGYIRKMVVGPKPYAKSIQTHPQYLKNSPQDFEKEKQHLLQALATLRETEGQQIKHPLFGEMSKEEKGWAMYKHLDHHLTQFGV
jgi:hypothetical protein